MKNSTAPNRKTGRMIAKNLIVLFTVALAGFCGIQAWFTDKQSAKADGINIECQAPDGIEIAVVKHKDPAPKDDAAYKNTIELNSANYPFIGDIKMTEVSSDGYNFYKPSSRKKELLLLFLMLPTGIVPTIRFTTFLLTCMFVQNPSSIFIWTVDLKSVRMQKF